MPYLLECVGEVATGSVLAFLMEVCTGYSAHSLMLEYRYGSIFHRVAGAALFGWSRFFGPAPAPTPTPFPTPTPTPTPTPSPTPTPN